MQIMCTECSGYGNHATLDCKDYSNECCGGCYKTTECETCKGTGYVEEEN